MNSVHLLIIIIVICMLKRRFNHNIQRVLTTSYCFMLTSLIFMILVSLTYNHDNNKKTFINQVMINDIHNTRIYDSNQELIYDKISNSDTSGYHQDKVLRESFYHLIGNENKGIETSILYDSNNNIDINIIRGYKPNNTFYTSINSELQKQAHLLLGNRKGCMLVYNYKTGEIVVSVSHPTTDPINEQIRDGLFLNKVYARYTPGSVFKAVTVGALLENSKIDLAEVYQCHKNDNGIICHETHGNVTLKEALYKSCNCGITYFANKYLKPSDFKKYLNKTTILSTKYVNQLNTNGEVFLDQDFAWTCNGQGDSKVTPIKMVQYYGAIANNGIMKEVSYFQGNHKDIRIMKEKTATFIKDTLSLGMKEWYKIDMNNVFGKTGTAELNNGVCHAWFIAGMNDQPYIILTFLEEGGFSTNARDLTVQYINNYLL